MVEWSVSLWGFFFFFFFGFSIFYHQPCLSGALKFSIYSLLHLWSFHSLHCHITFWVFHRFFFSSLMLLYKWHNILKLKLSGSCCVMSLRHSSSPGSWSFHILETPLPQETSPGSNSHLLHRILKVTLIFASNPIFLCLLLWTWLFLNPALQAETLWPQV